MQQGGKVLAVNQNMRFDEGFDWPRTDSQGEIGRPIFASIEMHAVPHWQAFSATTSGSRRQYVGTPLRFSPLVAREPLEVFAGRAGPRTHSTIRRASHLGHQFAGGTLGQS